MPWQRKALPELDYDQRLVRVHGGILPSACRSRVWISFSTIGVKKFRPMHRKSSNNFEWYTITNINILPESTILKKKDENAIIKEFLDLFLDDLPDHFPQKEKLIMSLKLTMHLNPHVSPFSSFYQQSFWLQRITWLSSYKLAKYNQVDRRVVLLYSSLKTKINYAV